MIMIINNNKIELIEKTGLINVRATVPTASPLTVTTIRFTTHVMCSKLTRIVMQENRTCCTIEIPVLTNVC